MTEAARRLGRNTLASEEAFMSNHAYFQNRHAFENTGSQLLWRHPDHLGTAVLRTNTDENKICDSRFYPYGCECARVWKIEFRAWNFARTEPRQS